ncbi:CMGC/MAPK protein kinase [Microbotryum lychnidis-dioicae p1A1 Lamole]|uniref:Mitogen-activated protein kinase n=1 Tax=Microbotryum lychnidis-dioicae (strain p1A1 Lamole / MvSl-1064) TaxID=683840 RepID=U5H1Z4_USTV1|nr:CMGC/MAPK protein kinase [Microbotryum lychnidis-dioicae p1A1 Lamole]|eukprot:KDE08349.1 CMGC/MAPK protein kinase [Microbotryum lychnidis-dioicae p1A1 Lamole]
MASAAVARASVPQPASTSNPSSNPAQSTRTTTGSSSQAGKENAPQQNATSTKPDQPKPAAEEPRKIRFSVGSKYAVQDVIGEGAYGVVCSAIHRPTGQKVAIKKIAPFDHSMFCLRTLRELKLLRYFSEQNVSENIISIVDIIKPTSFDGFKEVYLIQELMETDLHRVIRTQNLSDDHVQYFAYQTLRAIKALHSADVIHRDLKPSNLLLNANCDLKVCDFGLARSVTTAEPNGGETGFMTEYVATRWYRAPEIMLTFKQYTKAIDIWSVGCIIGEMISGRPLFPGRDYHHQLTLILDALGTPTLDEFYAINSRRSRDYLRAMPFRAKKPLSQIYPTATPEALDLMEKCLTFDPKKRITVEQALAHPYLANYHDPDDEPVAPPLEPSFFDFDHQKDSISREALKKLLYDEVMAFQPLV